VVFLEIRSRWRVLVIGLVGISTLLIYMYSPNLDLKSYAGNLSAGLFSSVLTIIFIDEAIERKRKNERTAINNVALKKLRHPLIDHLKVLSDWYKAAAPRPPASCPKTISDIFNDDYYQQIRFLCLNTKAPVITTTSWFNYNAENARIFKSNIDKIIDKYAVYLDPNSIELFESIANSGLINYLITLDNFPKRMATIGKALGINHPTRKTMLDDDGVIKLVKDHITLIIKLLDHYNKVAEYPIILEDLSLWQNNIEPLWGCSRYSSEFGCLGKVRILEGGNSGGKHDR
jgi:hypothetical protein